MHVILGHLKAWGCDIDGALARFMGDERLYVHCLKLFANDENFVLLEQRLSEHGSGAFEHAHTLKGVAANMGLTPLYAALCEVVESLRHDRFELLDEAHMRMLKALKRYRECLASA